MAVGMVPAIPGRTSTPEPDINPFTGITNGTGPFKLDHWTQGEEIVLVRNDDYWREPCQARTRQLQDR